MLLAEEMALVALRPDTGRPTINSGSLDDCLVGLLVADLALAGRVSVDDGDLEVVDDAQVGDDLLDHVLATLADKQSAGDLPPSPSPSPDDTAVALQRELVSYDLTGSLPRPARALFDRLADDGLATRRFSSVLGFQRHAWVPDSTLRRTVIDQLRTCALKPGRPDLRTAVLLVQLSEANLTRVVFPDARERQQARARTTTIRGQTELADNIALVISNLETAAVAAVSSVKG